MSDRPDTATDPLELHRSQTDQVIRSGDSVAIKNLYVELGDLLEEGHADDLAAVPVLSRPETHPVVAGLLEPVRGRVLDAGCGPRPAISIALAKAPGRTVISLDIGLGTVRLARAIAEQEGVRVLGVVGDLENLPFRTGTFDGIVCDDTIEHVPDDRRGIVELGRVLGSRGRLVLATPNRWSLLVIKTKISDRLRRRARPASEYHVSNSHLREYTWREAEALLGGVLRVERRRGVGWADGGWKRRVVSRAVTTSVGRVFSQMIVVDARHR